MKYIRYRVKLEEPALLTALDGDPNEGVSFNYIPGSVLRGAVIGRYLRQNGLSELDLTSSERECFFEGRLRFLNAYPVLNNTRTYPVPYSWLKLQNKPDTIHDDLWSSLDSSNEKRKHVNAPFHLRQADEVILYEPERYIAVHILRDRRGRPTADGGALYRYESLAPEQIFEAIILCEIDEDIDWLLPLLDGPFWIGGARTAGYGRCIWSLEGDPLDDWHEGPPNDAQGEWVIALMSNVILRDTYGQYAADLQTLVTHLKNRLGCHLEITRCQLDSEMVGGFNRKWGLPLPQTLSIKMGSVLHIAPCEVDWDRLIVEGIGERRSEGFGRIAVYQQANDQFSTILSQDVRPVEQVTLEGSEFTTAQHISHRIYEERVRQQIEKQANEIADHTRGKPNQAQLGELRQVIASALLEKTVTTSPIEIFLNEARAARRKQFEDFRLRGKDLIEWLQQKANKGPAEAAPVIGGAVHDATENAAYALRLLDAVLVRLMRDSVERSD